MDKLLSIQAFSERTGISKSSLRYYETKKLLIPAIRGENDYRYYTEKQVSEAKLIVSLRLAMIPMKEILRFLQGDQTTKEILRTQWIKEIEKKQELLAVGLQYLRASNSEVEIYLLEKPAQTVAWFRETGKPGSFGHAFLRWEQFLLEKGIRPKDRFLKYLHGQENEVSVLIGFVISEPYAMDFPAEVENMERTICIAYPYSSSFNQVQTAYHTLLNYANEHGWIPTGMILEWYRGNQMGEMELLLPVVKL